MPMDNQTAYTTLITEAYAPVFFGKLASEYGLQPASEEEAQGYIKMAGRLRNAHDLDRAKQASARVSAVEAANSQLDAMLNGGQETANKVKEAASMALQSPQIREAAAVFSDYLSQQAQ